MHNRFNPIKPFYLMDTALELSILHGTDFNYELERQARQAYRNSQTNWNDLVEKLPQDEGDAIRLFQAVALPDGQGWTMDPGVNLLAKDRIPTEPDARARYLTAILRFNLETCVWGYLPKFSTKAQDHHYLVGMALIEAEISAADIEGRERNIAHCAVLMKKLRDAPFEAGYNQLQLIRSEVEDISPRAAALLAEVLVHGEEHSCSALLFIEYGFDLIERAISTDDLPKAA